jgi:hypothetical protein
MVETIASHKTDKFKVLWGCAIFASRESITPPALCRNPQR